MVKFSRRQLARYAVEEMLAKRPPAALAERLAAATIVSGRQKELELLFADINQGLEDRGWLARARLTTAYPLSKKLRQEIASHLKKLTGVEKVNLVSQLDKNVIGGFKIETANHAWDKTIRRQLSDIKGTV